MKGGGGKGGRRGEHGPLCPSGKRKKGKEDDVSSRFSRWYVF